MGLEVAVDHAALVSEAGGAQDLDADVDRTVLRQRRLALDQILQSLALEELHRDVVGAVVRAAVEDVDHVWVLQAGCGARLAAEAFHELLVLREAVVQHLERHLAAEVGVLGAVHVRYAA